MSTANPSQTIHCTVESCKYNNTQRQMCELKQIIVTPTQNSNTKNPDESQCSSYKNIQSI